jgi:DnaJ-class molecular chaperone
MQSETITANGIERGGSDGVTINNVIVNNAENGGNSGGSGYEMSASNEYEDCSVCGGTGRVPLFFSFLRIWPCSTCGATGRVVKSESFSHKSSE